MFITGRRAFKNIFFQLRLQMDRKICSNWVILQRKCPHLQSTQQKTYFVSTFFTYSTGGIFSRSVWSGIITISRIPDNQANLDFDLVEILPHFHYKSKKTPLDSGSISKKIKQFSTWNNKDIRLNVNFLYTWHVLAVSL